MKHLVAAVLTCLLTAGGLAPGLAQAQELAQRVAWNQPEEPFTVIGNVHYVGVEELAAFLITTPEGHILIDGALPESAPLVAASIRALGFDPADVRLLLNTHAHMDHAGGLAELKGLTGAALIASEGDRSALEQGRHFGLTNYGVWQFPPVAVDRVIADGETVALGGVVLTAHVTPGHTRGCTTWSLPVRQDQTQLDVVIFCSASVGGNRLVENTEYPGIVADYRRTFDRLETMSADVFLTNHPGMSDMHGRRARQKAGETDAFVDPAIMPGVVARLRSAFEAELGRQAREQ